MRGPCMYSGAQRWAFTLAWECVGSIHHIYSLPTPVSWLKTFIVFTPCQSCLLDILAHFPLKTIQTHRKCHLRQHKKYKVEKGQGTQWEYTNPLTKGCVKSYRNCTTAVMGFDRFQWCCHNLWWKYAMCKMTTKILWQQEIKMLQRLRKIIMSYKCVSGKITYCIHLLYRIDSHI